jgi:hypothetical protein
MTIQITADAELRNQLTTEFAACRTEKSSHELTPVLAANYIFVIATGQLLKSAGLYFRDGHEEGI